MKKVLLIAVVLIAMVAVLSACRQGEDSDLITVRVSEVTRSVFYAPQYVAIAMGFFEDEGLSIDLFTSDGADRVMTALLTGAADIGFSGPEATIYVFNEGRTDHAVVFAQVTKRDGSFLIAREPMPNFTWDDIRGAHVLPGRRGGMPFMALEYVTRMHGILPDVDVTFDTSIAFAAMVSAFVNGTGDFVTAFEPVASTIEAEGRGFVVASVGEASGEIPYTAYYALASFIEANPEVIQGFTNALYRGQRWTLENSAADIARVIAPFFPEADPVIMENAIARYKEIDAFSATPIMTRESFDRMQRVMESAGELTQRAPFERLVDNRFAEIAVGR
ncbi:MAG: ABC transporter substrate-binding protein [Defluviitaleaceae bacterium]|nr:ABC transporter substrate-binding protein [Defluviitaleaceae bacterium]MCL2273815.1 ABC transporter substrate-binding protein [Defluviitaleaceae bacterium]